MPAGMSDEQPSTEGAGRTVALVVAFLLLPLPIYLMAKAGYTGGRVKVDFMLLSPIFASVFWAGGMLAGGLQLIVAFIARGSTRFVVRRLALLTLILCIAGGIGSCAGGCVWGKKVKANEWPEPSLLRRPDLSIQP